MIRKLQHTLVKHVRTGVLHLVRLCEDPTPAELKKAGEAYGEPRHVLQKGKIGLKRRKRGVWQYDPDDEDYIFFTCPWCGAIGRTESHYVGSDGYESIWCGRQGLSEKVSAKGCNRHLSLYYHIKPKAMQVISPHDL